MRGVVSEVRILVTVSYVEVLCSDDCLVYICHALLEDLEGSLIAVWVYVDYVVGIPIIIKGQDIDVAVVYNIQLQSESHPGKAFVDISSDSCIVFLCYVLADEQDPF